MCGGIDEDVSDACGTDGEGITSLYGVLLCMTFYICKRMEDNEST